MPENPQWSPVHQTEFGRPQFVHPTTMLSEPPSADRRQSDDQPAESTGPLFAYGHIRDRQI